MRTAAICFFSVVQERTTPDRNKIVFFHVAFFIIACFQSKGFQREGEGEQQTQSGRELREGGGELLPAVYRIIG